MKLKELKNRFNKKYVVRIVAGVLSIALIGSGSAFYGVSNAKAANEKTQSSTTVENAADESLLSGLLSGVTVSQKVIDKEESVYVITDAKGTVVKTIVSDRLANNDGKDSIKDKTNLSDIVNVKGDETFTEANGALTWQANGNSISYQGTTNAEVPVTQKVTYYLDGKEIAPEELAGKSGKVTIHFDYTNNTSYKANVNGKEIDVKVPFAAISAVVLNDSFTNVEVTNGKAKVSDGKSVVIGYTLPGLSESLDMEDDSIPEYFEITADVEKFELSTAMTLVVNAANYVGTEGIDLTSLDETIGKLSDAASQLQDGSSQLSEGLKTLKGSLGEFVDGMKTLQGGINAYTDGAKQVADGIKKLRDSVPSLTSGVAVLNSSAATLNAGIAKLDKTLNTPMTDAEKKAAIKAAQDAVDASYKNGTQKQISDQIYTALCASDLYTTLVNSGIAANYEAALEANYAAQKVTVFKGVVASKAGLFQLAQIDTTKLSTESDYFTAIKKALENASVNGNGTTYVKAGYMTADQVQEATIAYDMISEMSSSQAAEFFYARSKKETTLYEAVDAAVDKALASDETKKAAETKVKTALRTLADTLAASTKTISKEVAGLTAVTSAETTKSTIAKAIEAKDEKSGYSLVTGMAALAEGTKTLNDSVPALSDGVEQLYTGSQTLVSKNKELTAGITKLTDASLLIQDGVDKLDDGANKLADGILQFNEEGIEKLVNAYDGDVKEFADKIQAVLDAGESYQIFTDMEDGANGSVKFIYKLGSVTL